MGLVLSNAFKGLLLSSYVNIKYDLAVKSFEDLIEKPKVELFYEYNIDNFIRKGTNEIINKLDEQKRIKRYGKQNPWTKELYGSEKIKLFKKGKAVILCPSVECPTFQISFAHLNLIMSTDQQVYSPLTLRIRKTHSHSNQIRKL